MSAFWLLLAVLLALGLVAAWLERREWSGGICKANGLPWEHFDTDSQGGRGYRAGEEVTWQSWGADKRRQYVSSRNG